MECPQQCLVCSATIASVHLGMDICRACAAFFKRAKMTGVVYSCRQGTNQCIGFQERKFACRRCRFEKCLSVGLVYEGLMRVRANPPPPLLERVGKELKSMLERRRTKELEYLIKCRYKRIRVYTISAVASADILKTTFNESLERIFKDYVAKLSLVVNYYLTHKIWGDSDKKVMSSVMTCFDTEVPFDFYYPEDKGDKEFFKSSILSHMADFISIFQPQFKRANLSEKEYHALAAIVLTENYADCSEETEQIMDDIRREIFENLQCYYGIEMGLIDFSTRLGNLMSMNHIIQECRIVHKETVRFYTTFFDIYMAEKMVELMSLD